MENKSIILILFILQAITNDVNLTEAVSYKEDRHVCRGGDFKSDNIRKNRDSAFDKLFTLLNNSSIYAFQHAQVGDKPDEQVRASFFCNPTFKGLCECCLRNVIQYIKKKCPKQNEAVAWDFYFYHTCMVRYSTSRKILSVLDDWAWYRDWDKSYVKAIDLGKTMDSLTSKLNVQAAGGGDALKRFATGKEIYDGEEFALYVSVQCTPDISKEDCLKCLSKASTEIRSCCIKKLQFAGIATSTNCYAWYTHVSIFGKGDVSPVIVSNSSCS